MKTDGRDSNGRVRCRLILALALAWAAGAGAAVRPPAGALGQSAIAEFEPLTPDLALPHAPPPASPAWLGDAIVLQPWRATQHAALTDVGDRPRRLRSEFGFNTIIVLPPEANNAGVLPKHRQTEEEFRAGLDAYRRAGYRVILYSSVVQSGMDPVWHNGHLERAHPEWSQRDAEGRPLTKYGHPWLCPSSPALEYSLDYTERLARRYGADGIMLDNNQFFYTDEKNPGPSTWTCYCDYCQHKFRDYAVRRFGPERLKRVFGVDAGGLRIPTEEGALRALWIHWRNRVWAETNEVFRERLRRVDPGMMLFANHQYDWPDGVLASDLQYEHEDVVLSESRELTSWRMSAKMLVGGALAGDRPLWNYVGTFEEKDYARLRPQEVVGPIIGASLAHRARPWIVYFGFHDEQGNYQARREMGGLLSWYASHPGLFVGKRWAPVGVVVSPLNRNIRGRELIPGHLSELLHRGVGPVRAFRDDRLTPAALRDTRVLTVENAVCMSETRAELLGAWVRGGGTLVGVPEAGWEDELGRRRGRSVLWEALALESGARGVMTVGRGKVVISEAPQLAKTVGAMLGGDTLRVTGQTGVEVVPYAAPGMMLVHVVRHAPVRGPASLELPASVGQVVKAAVLHAPGRDRPQSLPLNRRGGRITVGLTDVPVYGVVVIEW
jgi:hypothetical protein